MTKAAETRKIHAAAREEKRREKNEITQLIRKTCLMILDDPEAAAAEKMKAVEILKEQIERW